MSELSSAPRPSGKIRSKPTLSVDTTTKTLGEPSLWTSHGSVAGTSSSSAIHQPAPASDEFEFEGMPVTSVGTSSARRPSVPTIQPASTRLSTSPPQYSLLSSSPSSRTKKSPSPPTRTSRLPEETGLPPIPQSLLLGPPAPSQPPRTVSPTATAGFASKGKNRKSLGVIITRSLPSLKDGAALKRARKDSSQYDAGPGPFLQPTRTNQSSDNGSIGSSQVGRSPMTNAVSPSSATIQTPMSVAGYSPLVQTGVSPLSLNPQQRLQPPSRPILRSNHSAPHNALPQVQKRPPQPQPSAPVPAGAKPKKGLAGFLKKTFGGGSKKASTSPNSPAMPQTVLATPSSLQEKSTNRAVFPKDKEMEVVNEKAAYLRPSPAPAAVVEQPPQHQQEEVLVDEAQLDGQTTPKVVDLGSPHIAQTPEEVPLPASPGMLSFNELSASPSASSSEEEDPDPKPLLTSAPLPLRTSPSPARTMVADRPAPSPTKRKTFDIGHSDEEDSSEDEGLTFKRPSRSSSPKMISPKVNDVATFAFPVPADHVQPPPLSPPPPKTNVPIMSTPVQDPASPTKKSSAIKAHDLPPISPTKLSPPKQGGSIPQPVFQGKGQGAPRSTSGPGSADRARKPTIGPPAAASARYRSTSGMRDGGAGLQRKGSKFRKSVYGLADTLSGKQHESQADIQKRASVSPTMHTMGSISRETNEIMDREEKDAAESFFMM